jgi:hypothetical protein
VKSSEQNPLRQALTLSQKAGAHPDPDLLTAFAEGALIASEREDMLAHLAVCAECREVLSIASAASAEPAAEASLHVLPRPSHPPLRSWLPWVAVAAGIVVCSAVLIRHQRKPALTPSPQVTIATKTAPVPIPPYTADQLQTSPVSKAKHTKPPRPSLEKPQEASPNAQNSSVIASAPAEADGTLNPVPADRRSADRAASAAAAEGGPQAGNGQAYISGRRVTAFAGTAPAPTTYGALSLQALRPQWRINDSGQVERSIGGGPWQPVLTDEKSRMRVVSVFDRDVWIGGDDSRLYHSTDNGATWNAIALPNKDGREHAITHIRFQTLQSGTVDADDGTSWTTTDGGKNWN